MAEKNSGDSREKKTYRLDSPRKSSGQPERISLDAPSSSLRRSSQSAADRTMRRPSPEDDLTKFHMPELDPVRMKRWAAGIFVVALVVVFFAGWRRLYLTGRYRFLDPADEQPVQAYVGIALHDKKTSGIRIYSRDITFTKNGNYTEYKIDCHYWRWLRPLKVMVILTSGKTNRAIGDLVPLDTPTQLPELILKPPQPKRKGRLIDSLAPSATSTP